ncbi:MAG: hypothetical protein ACYTEP_07410, partial [Planctomycetota bacterium]
SNCSGGGVSMSPGWGAGGTFTVELWDALPNVAGANMLATGSAPASPGTWVDVFWPAVTVTPGTTYYMVYFCTDGSMAIDGDVNNPYSGGQVYANPPFGSWPTFDYTFNTWTDAGGGGLTLSVSGSCPGTMTLSVSGAGAGSAVAIAYGPAGSFTIPSGSCAGLALGIASPSLGAMLTADAAGDASASPSIPGGACGLTVQAVDLGACSASNTVVL